MVFSEEKKIHWFLFIMRLNLDNLLSLNDGARLIKSGSESPVVLVAGVEEPAEGHCDAQDISV